MIGAFANAAGGYDKVGFLKKDLHNQILRQRKSMSSDAKGAVRYLKDLRSKDPLKLYQNDLSLGSVYIFRKFGFNIFCRMNHRGKFLVI
jgi:hypothetical protein